MLIFLFDKFDTEEKFLRHAYAAPINRMTVILSSPKQTGETSIGGPAGLMQKRNRRDRRQAAARSGGGPVCRQPAAIPATTQSPPSAGNSFHRISSGN